MGKAFHGVDSSFEFLLVDVTGTVGINLLESGFDGFLVLLWDLDIMLLLDILDEVDDFVPGNGLGSIGIEDLENILPRWGTLFGGDLSKSIVICGNGILEFVDLLLNLINDMFNILNTSPTQQSCSRCSR